MTERARVDAGVARRLAAVPGVRRAIVDQVVPARVLARGAAIAGPGATRRRPIRGARRPHPYGLRAGRAPRAGRGRRRRRPRDPRAPARRRARAPRRHRPGRARHRRGHRRAADGGPPRPRLFVTDAEAARLAGHPGRADAIGVLPAPGADRTAPTQRLRTAADPPARVLTGSARGGAEDIGVADAREAVIAIAGTFGGLAMLIAMFVVASTLGLAIQLREREIALLRAIAATPRQVRRMIGWETLLLALVASLAGVVPGVALGSALGRAFADRGIAPEDMVIHAGVFPRRGGGPRRRRSPRGSRCGPPPAGPHASRRPAPSRTPPSSRASSARCAGSWAWWRSAAPPRSPSCRCRRSRSTPPPRRAACIAVVLVIGAACLGPLVARVAAWMPGALVARSSRVGGFLAVANVRSAARRFSSASTPLVLTVRWPARCCSSARRRSTRPRPRTATA